MASKRIEWSQRSLADLRSILDAISQDDPPTAAAVGERILAAVERLAEFPGIGRPGRRSGTRELVLPHLPYVVVYNVINETAFILRLLHTSMNWPNT